MLDPHFDSLVNRVESGLLKIQSYKYSSQSMYLNYRHGSEPEPCEPTERRDEGEVCISHTQLPFATLCRVNVPFKLLKSWSLKSRHSSPTLWVKVRERGEGEGEGRGVSRWARGRVGLSREASRIYCAKAVVKQVWLETNRFHSGLILAGDVISSSRTIRLSWENLPHLTRLNSSW